MIRILLKKNMRLERFVILLFASVLSASCSVGRTTSFNGPQDTYCDVGGVTISVNMASSFDQNLWGDSWGEDHPKGFNFEIKFPKEMVSDILNISGEYCYGKEQTFCSPIKQKLEIVKFGRTPGSPGMNYFTVFVKPTAHIEIVKGQYRLEEGNYKIWLKFDYNNITFNSIVQVSVKYYSKVGFIFPGCLLWTIGVLTSGF